LTDFQSAAKALWTVISSHAADQAGVLQGKTRGKIVSSVPYNVS
jgi:hypothetical protein